ncbi:DNA alkylation repair protein [Candidatus Saccharibacteria bacterium]|nr:DNA alkylation repair protein [Candidatus Saccharibacteria bacterium]
MREKLEDLRDDAYGDFIAKGIPGFSRTYFLGVRVPEIRRMTDEMLMLVFGQRKWSRELTSKLSNGFNKKLYHEMNKFLEDLPHPFLEYDFAQVEIISQIDNFEECLQEIQKFLPYVNNWAVCDTLNPSIFKKNLDRVLELAFEWMEDERAFVVRFGIGEMQRFFLAERFSPDFLEKVAVCADRVEAESGWAENEKYYVRMMVAWYMATALAKQWDATLEILTAGCLPEWVHNKAIQKAIESRRISREQKAFLRGLKR